MWRFRTATRTSYGLGLLIEGLLRTFGVVCIRVGGIPTLVGASWPAVSHLPNSLRERPARVKVSKEEEAGWWGRIGTVYTLFIDTVGGPTSQPGVWQRNGLSSALAQSTQPHAVTLWAVCGSATDRGGGGLVAAHRRSRHFEL